MTGMGDKLSTVLGAKTAKALDTTLNLRTVAELLRHYPRRYQRRGELTDIGGLEIGEHVTVMAKIERTEKRPMRQRKGQILTVHLTDGKRRLTCAFFGNQAWRERELRAGRTGLFARSEEHTSELQSRENLVCRLLLEKKNTNNHKYDQDN